MQTGSLIAVAIFLVAVAGRAAADDARVWLDEMAQQHQLELAHRHSEALANVRKLRADPRLTSEQYAELLDREAFNLFNLNRPDEAIACYDRQIADAVDHPAEKLRLLEAKADLVLSHVEPAAGVAACRAFRQATIAGSRPWASATAMLALALTRNGEHARAIRLRESLLKLPPDIRQSSSATLWIEIAQSQSALSRADEALRSLDQAEKALLAKPNNRRESTRQLAQIAALRQSIREAR